MVISGEKRWRNQHDALNTGNGFVKSEQKQPARFWSAVEYGCIPEFLSRLKARGCALMAKWGQDILLKKNGKQKDLSSLSSCMQWQWQWSLELCQKWQPQTSTTGNVNSWNLEPLGIHAAQP